MMRIFELLAAFFLGGGVYGLLELAWRGRTHWTMLPAGGTCFLFMYLAAGPDRLPLPGQWLLCAALTTAVEFVTGAVVNIGLGWDVWDYSHRPFNLYGQVCAQYTVLWFLLSIPGCALAGFLYRSVFHRGL